MKRILSFLLVLAMLLSTLLLVGCPDPDGPNGPDGPGGDGSGDWADTLDTAEIRAIAAKLDEDKRSVVFSLNENYAYEVYAEETSTDPRDKLIYERNKKIEERFGIEVETHITKPAGATDNESHLTYVRNQLATKRPSFDVVMMMAYQSGKLIAGGNYRDLRTATPYIQEDIVNESSVWWPSDMNTSATVKGHQFVGLSDMSVTAIDLSYGLLFNADMMNDENVIADFNTKEKTNYATIYDLVDAGAWTLDNLTTITKDFWRDNAADSVNAGTVDPGDKIGFFGGTSTDLDAFAYSFGFMYINNDGVSDPTVWTMPTTFDTAVTKLRNLFSSNGATMAGRGNPAFKDITYSERNAFFAGGHALFKSASLKDVMSSAIKGMEQNYGIIPYPKYNKDQANYLTGISDQVSVISIPTFTRAERLRLTGATVVALSAETNKSFNDAYYEMIVKHGSGFVDKRSVEMVDKIVSGRVYDLGFYHHAELKWSDEDNACFATLLRYLLWTGNDTNAVWQQIRDTSTSKLNGIVRNYDNLTKEA